MTFTTKVWGIPTIQNLYWLLIPYVTLSIFKYSTKAEVYATLVPPNFTAWFIGGIFVILSFPISVYEVAMHTEYYTRPRLQRHVIRILWMVPIYGVDAWLALRFRDAREYLDPIRECYEAYVIYNFYAYLVRFGGCC